MGFDFFNYRVIVGDTSGVLPYQSPNLATNQPTTWALNGVRVPDGAYLIGLRLNMSELESPGYPAILENRSTAHLTHSTLPVPEPSGALLPMAGLGGLVARRALAASLGSQAASTPVTPRPTLDNGVTVTCAPASAAPHSLADAAAPLSGRSNPVTPYVNAVNLNEASVPLPGPDPWFAIRVLGGSAGSAAEQAAALALAARVVRSRHGAFGFSSTCPAASNGPRSSDSAGRVSLRHRGCSRLRSKACACTAACTLNPALSAHGGRGAGVQGARAFWPSASGLARQVCAMSSTPTPTRRVCGGAWSASSVDHEAGPARLHPAVRRGLAHR